MTRLSRRSRVLLGACTYFFVAISVTGGACFTILAPVPGALTTGESARAVGHQNSVRKIGLGYARLLPIERGKPQKVAYSTPYYRHVAAPRAATAKQHPAPTTIIAESSAATTPPTKIAAAGQSSDSLTDIHRVY
jgi:hypothetical protein